ncbi:cation diffusion facilitator family transporter [Alicyclobacillus fastidiosus]|uniref:Cation diffusion facilitator family transporter n=1 Tax=Alicyclobacillus fastidiosus TaxID=392011 RepID=A0ABV5AE53_9BACL|nr:cation diffusion facilitator family transporter [Alicyclobacillus fastidiosus]WEH11369.1 cation diffusion facilitator family transporter [Alicyclobacillus fastidiosus]
MSDRNTPSFLAGWVNLASNVLLTALKIVVGVLFRSSVLFADGIHSAADVVASVATLGAMRVSIRPADEDHPYGHGKAEVIASGIVGVLLFLASVWILYHGVESLLAPVEKASILPFIAAAVSLVWKQILYLYTMRIGKKYRSKGLIATAYDHLSDVYSSLAAVIGIGIALIGRYTGHSNLGYADPICSIVVALFIWRITYSISRETIDGLMEKNVPQEKINMYEHQIKNVREVKRIDRIRARELGHYILVDVRVGVHGDMTIQQGHDISRVIKSAIMETDADVKEVLVHLNPWYKDERLSAGSANEIHE